MRRFRLGRLNLGQQFLLRVDTRQSDKDVRALPVPTVTERNAPTLGKDSQRVLESVDRADGTSPKGDQYVTVFQSSPSGVRRGQDVGNDHLTVLTGRHRGAQGRVIDNPTASQVAHEVLDLIDADGIPHAHVDASPFFERAATVDADQVAVGIEQRTTGVAGIDRGVGLDAIGVFQQRAGRILVTMDAGHDAVGHGRLKVGCQKKRVANREAPIAHAHFVAVGKRRRGEIVAPDELDQGHVADRINAYDDGVVQITVRQTALHMIAGRLDDVIVRQRITVGRDHHARSTSSTAASENRSSRFGGFGDGGNPLLFGIQNRLRDFIREESGSREFHE